jgi:hypothetical protein
MEGSGLEGCHKQKGRAANDGGSQHISDNLLKKIGEKRKIAGKSVAYANIAG